MISWSVSLQPEKFVGYLWFIHETNMQTQPKKDRQGDKGLSLASCRKPKTPPGGSSKQSQLGSAILTAKAVIITVECDAKLRQKRNAY
jgi:hypothetical protein